ncbi:MAG: hypothetical protein GVY02_07605 [Bacteroidetes bacterium]|jgi:hypothetical protein|nr:hypothetical protein [Bacteroidota bacterium]
MRIDPKYFNRFMIVVAVISLVIIAYSTVRYFQVQIDEFEQNISGMQADTLGFSSFQSPDSLRLDQFSGTDLVIHFWATWSNRSDEVNRLLYDFSEEHDSLTVILAAVRDSEEEVESYISMHDYPFHYVDGTELFQKIMAPGIPTQLFFDNRGELQGYHVGDELDEIENELDRLKHE